jgi:hypothetical protein
MSVAGAVNETERLHLLQSELVVHLLAGRRPIRRLSSETYHCPANHPDHPEFGDWVMDGLKVVCKLCPVLIQ